MKEKLKKILDIIVTILIIAFALLWNSWSTYENEYGETVCKNVFGKVSKCK